MCLVINEFDALPCPSTMVVGAGHCGLAPELPTLYVKPLIAAFPRWVVHGDGPVDAGDVAPARDVPGEVHCLNEDRPDVVWMIRRRRGEGDELSFHVSRIDGLKEPGRCVAPEHSADHEEGEIVAGDWDGVGLACPWPCCIVARGREADGHGKEYSEVTSKPLH